MLPSTLRRLAAAATLATAATAHAQADDPMVSAVLADISAQRIEQPACLARHQQGMTAQRELPCFVIRLPAAHAEDVVDGRGLPVEGAILLVAHHGRTITDPNGRFAFDGVPPGPLPIVVVAERRTLDLEGAEVDYKEDLMGGGFAIKNPNAKSTCGCGSSFSA